MFPIRSSKRANHLEPVIMTALKTGMRKGEVLGLKWSNVDFPIVLSLLKALKTAMFEKFL